MHREAGWKNGLHNQALAQPFDQRNAHVSEARPEFPDQCQMRLTVLEQSRGAAIAEVDFLELRCVLRLLDARLADVGDQNVAASEMLMQIFK